MKIISKTISYNNLVSRIPGVIPSIMDSWVLPSLYRCGVENESEIYFSYDKAVKRAEEYNLNPSSLEYQANFITFDKDNIREYNIGNYGLIPSDIILPQEIADIITEYTDIYVNLKDENGEFYDLSFPKNNEDPHYDGRKIVSGANNQEIKVITYVTLNKWYSFFKKYYRLIANPEYVRTYSSATEYYEYEVGVKDATVYDEYAEMDEYYKAIGGEDVYEWITNNCIIVYKIPEEFVYEWKITELYYPQALKWYQWFMDRDELYKDVEFISDCKDVDDCCDCKEYLRLGGSKFFKGEDGDGGLKKWVEGLEDFDTSFATNSASITIPITLTTTIDDLGEMSIFSNDWQEEVDYHNTLTEKGYSLLDGAQGGTVVHQPYETDNDTGDKTLLDDTYMIKNGVGYKGYEYNDYYENVFKVDNWLNYTDYYYDVYKKDIASDAVAQSGELEPVTSYTFSPLNGKVIYNPAEKSITSTTELFVKDIVVIDGNIYDVIDGKYVTLCYNKESIANIKYKKRVKLPILNDGGLDYAELNGKKKYVETTEEGEERVYFLKPTYCEDEGCKVEEGKYIIFDNLVYLIEDGSITLKDKYETNSEEEGDEDKHYDWWYSERTYPVLNGYFELNGITYYLKGNDVVVSRGGEYDNNGKYTFKYSKITEEELLKLGYYELSFKSDTEIKISHVFDTYNCDIISGYTDSKLELLRRKEITTDRLGNELPGHFKDIVDITKGEDQSIYNTPYNECTLDILYKVGEVSEIKPSDLGDDYFNGNILTDITFYYLHDDGSPAMSSAATEDNALDVIEKLTSAFTEASTSEELDGGDADETLVDDLMCDITFYMGAVIKKNGKKYELDEEHHNGVKYVATSHVRKRTGTYYMDEDKSFTYNYYELKPAISTVPLSDYNDDYKYEVTYFEFKPMIWHVNNDKIELKDESIFEDFDNHNGLMASPTFRTEYNLASSLPQIVNANIYIDRGINAAFEKHLKLQEFRTMEALENLGNGYFKINNY